MDDVIRAVGYVTGRRGTILKRKKCIICDRMMVRGISVLGQFVCRRCEDGIVKTSPFDSDYDFYRDRFKAFWRTVSRPPACRDNIIP
ncbi:MAG TPA: hypothetical protein GXX51_01360 [Firmicutes bacterium]|nr:hypothetical protein [Bacillota bacterium]